MLIKDEQSFLNQKIDKLDIRTFSINLSNEEDIKSVISNIITKKMFDNYNFHNIGEKMTLN